MIFGSADDFAIEAKLIGPGKDPKWLFGNLRLWVTARQLGDFDDVSDLAGSARWGRTFLKESQRRSRPELDDHTFISVYQLLYGRYQEPQDVRPPPWDSRPFVLNELGESSTRDLSDIVVVRRADGRDRIIVHNVDAECLFSHTIAAGMCDDVVEQYCRWVEGIGRSLGTPNL